MKGRKCYVDFLWLGNNKPAGSAFENLATLDVCLMYYSDCKYMRPFLCKLHMHNSLQWLSNCYTVLNPVLIKDILCDERNEAERRIFLIYIYVNVLARAHNRPGGSRDSRPYRLQGVCRVQR